MMPTLKLYIAGNSPYARAAMGNVDRALKRLRIAPSSLEIIDVYERPDLAADARVLVTPTLIRLDPTPRRIIGDLSAEQELTAFLS